MTHESEIEAKPCRYEPPLVMGGQDREPREIVAGAGIWFVGILVGVLTLGLVVGFAVGRFT